VLLPLNNDGIGAVVVGQNAKCLSVLPWEETLSARPGLPSNFGPKLVLLQQLFLHDRLVDKDRNRFFLLINEISIDTMCENQRVKIFTLPATIRQSS
jgi:hypothetical protein